MKILISAFGCSPGEGSEHGRGWEFVSRLSHAHQIWVITHASNREKIEAHLRQNAYPNLYFSYLDIPFVSAVFSLLPHNIPFYAYFLNIYYYLWQLALYPLAVKLHHQIRFDISHHISYARYWMPSLLSLLPIPFVWGAVAGADLTPSKLMPAFSTRGRFFEFSRRLMIFIGEMDPLVRITARRAAVVIPCTSATFQRLKHMGARRLDFAFDVGISIESSGDARAGCEPASLSRFVVMSVGRLVDWKGFSLGIRAFAQTHPANSEYWVFGDGPDRTRLESLADSLGIRNQVRFFGRVPRSEVLQAYQCANVLLHPSLHETWGWAVMEAMAFGLPVICLDLGGPPRIVANEAGICIPANDVDQVVGDITQSLLLLENHPEICKKYGDAGKRRVALILNWDQIISHILEIYQSLCQEGKGD